MHTHTCMYTGMHFYMEDTGGGRRSTCGPDKKISKRSSSPASLSAESTPAGIVVLSSANPLFAASLCRYFLA